MLFLYIYITKSTLNDLNDYRCFFLPPLPQSPEGAWPFYISCLSGLLCGRAGSCHSQAQKEMLSCFGPLREIRLNCPGGEKDGEPRNQGGRRFLKVSPGLRRGPRLCRTLEWQGLGPVSALGGWSHSNNPCSQVKSRTVLAF